MLKLNPIGSNMTELTIGGVTMLFSYKTPVACHTEGKGYFKTSKKWSVTTSRHINKWLNGAEATEKPQSDFDSIIASTMD